MLPRCQCIVPVGRSELSVVRNSGPAEIAGEFIGKEHLSPEGVAWNPILIIHGIQISRLAEVAQVVCALDVFGFGLGPAQGRQAGRTFDLRVRVGFCLRFATPSELLSTTILT